MYEVYLGLGSNLGDRQKNLETAVEGLSSVVKITAVSPIYETEAWGLVDQPDFLNMCAAGRTDLPPRELLRFVKDLEVQMGRESAVRWGPRLIDIDILLYSGLVVRSADLNVPHEGFAERATVLVPLTDIAPELADPLSGEQVSQLAAGVDQSGVKPYEPAI